MSIIHDNDFKNGYKHGMRLLAASMYYKSPASSDSLIKELHDDDTVNPIAGMPSIREWLDEHNAMNMNAHELDKTLTEYERLVDTYDKRLEAFIAGMKAANFTIISLTIMIIIMLAFLLTLIP